MMNPTPTMMQPKPNQTKTTSMEQNQHNDDKLRKNYQYYLDNYDELVKQYDGKVLVLTDCRVADVCEDEIQAYEEGAIKYGLGNFIFQRCSSQQKTYTITLSPSHFIPRVTPYGVLPPLVSLDKESFAPTADTVRPSHNVRQRLATQA